MLPIPFSRLAATLAAVLSLSLAAVSQQCYLQWRAGDPIPTPRGEVSGITWWDPDGAGPAPAQLTVCGRFAAGSATSCSVATFDGSRWTSIGGWIGYARCLTVHAGQLVVAADDIVQRWTGTAWQVLGTATGSATGNPAVQAMTVFQGDLYVGGYFSHVDGLPAARIARWDGSSWSAVGAGIGGNFVQALAVYANQLYVGGMFTTAGGVPASSLAAWSGSGWSSVASVNGVVYALAVRTGIAATDSHLFVGGNFTAVGALAIEHVARYTAATGAWTSFGPLPLSPCRSLFVRNTTFSYEVVAADMSGNTLRRTGSTWGLLGTAVTGAGTTQQRPLHYRAGRYVTGWGAGVSLGGISEFDGLAWQPLSGAALDTPRAVLPHDDGLVVGGDFQTVGGVPLHGIAVGGPGAWQPLGGGVTGGTGAVHALARLPNGDLVAAGSFALATGGVADRIARWDGVAWHPLGNGMNGTVNALTVMPTGDLIAGGEFTTAGAVPASHVARWNGAFWLPIGGGVDGTVLALCATAANDLYVGGSFASANGAPAANIAVAAGGSLWFPLPGGTDAAVYALASEANGHVLIGGAFTQAGGAARPGVARWTGTWQTLPGWPVQPIGTVRAIAVLPDSTFVLAGDAITLPIPGHGNLTDRAFRIWSAQLEALGVGPTGAVVRCATPTPDGSLAIGGSFFVAGGVVSNGIARMEPACPAQVSAYGSGCAGAGGPDVLTALTLPWDGEVLQTRATGLPFPSLALVVYGFQQISVPISLLLPEGLPGCRLYVSPDILGLALPSAGAVDCQVFVATSPSLVGATFYHQVVPLELDAGGTITGITATNGLLLRVGSY